MVVLGRAQLRLLPLEAVGLSLIVLRLLPLEAVGSSLIVLRLLPLEAVGSSAIVLRRLPRATVNVRGRGGFERCRLAVQSRRFRASFSPLHGLQP